VAQYQIRLRYTRAWDGKAEVAECDFGPPTSFSRAMWTVATLCSEPRSTSPTRVEGVRYAPTAAYAVQVAEPSQLGLPL
jgi:hypothetical protein